MPAVLKGSHIQVVMSDLACMAGVTDSGRNAHCKLQPISHAQIIQTELSLFLPLYHEVIRNITGTCTIFKGGALRIWMHCLLASAVTPYSHQLG